MLERFLSVLIIVSLLPVGCAGAYTIGTASMPAPAVIPDSNGEALTMINLTVTSGIGNVTVVGPATVGSSTLQSAYSAAQYASTNLGLNFTDYNFTYTIESSSSNVTGPSAGAAMALLALSALGHRQLRSDFTITGTVSIDGSIGTIGGVYNKVEAARQNGLDLVLVPKVPENSGDNELYLLVQTEFGIPLVQVANVTQASAFAFNSEMSGLANMTGQNFYTDYGVDALPQATIACSNQCNESTFSALANYTFGLTRDMVNTLVSSSRFYNVSKQFDGVLAQSERIADRGYLYAAANFAFLDYLNAFYFNAHDVTKGSALTELKNVQAMCSSLVQPQITTVDYEYVLGAELRQVWGNFTVNATLSAYNETATETDSILDSVRGGAEASGWCGAAGFTYGQFMNSAGSPIGFSPALSGIALQRLDRASRYGAGLYLNTAQQAYSNGDYPLAILDADYAFAVANASAYGSQTTQQLLSTAQSTAQNSTYGVWATEFAKEVQFFAYQAGATSNETVAHSYAMQAYTSALLAEQFSSDVKLIYDNRVSLSNVTANTTQSLYLAELVNQLAMTEKLMTALLALVVVILAANLALIAILIKRSAAKDDKRGRRRK